MKKPPATPVERLRGEIWVKACMRGAKVKTQSGLVVKTGHIVSDRTSWSKYKSGIVKPPASTVTLINRISPGTKRIWDSGPFKLPFWKVLQGDLASCDAYLKKFLGNSQLPDGSCLYGKNIDTATLSDCLLALLQIFLPSSIWRRTVRFDIKPAVDELYECRRRLLCMSDEESVPVRTKPTSTQANASPNPVLEEMAWEYYAKGLVPPWEEDAGTVEGVNVFDNPRQPVVSLPVGGMTVEEFLSAFLSDPDYDDEFEITYEAAPVKSLKYVPKHVQAMAHDLTWSRLPPNKRYIAFNLSDLLILEPNPLFALYEKFVINSKRPMSPQNLKKFNGVIGATPNLFKYDTLLAFVAAIFLCRSSRSTLEKKVGDFLWHGVHIAIRSQFDQAVYDIVKP